MYTVFDKDTINSEIMLHLSTAKCGNITKSDLVEIINAILYKLRTGCQWKFLPVKELFTRKALSYNSVYHHYRKWCKAGEWKNLWLSLLDTYRHMLDMSSIDLDGSHATAIRGGEKCGYQGRKKRKTTNAWIDSFGTLLNRFDTTVSSWKSWNYIAFCVLFLGKIKKRTKV